MKNGSCINSTSLLQKLTNNSVNATSWPPPMLCTISGFTSYAMSTLWAISPRVLPSQPVLSGKLGSDEADDGPYFSCGNAHLGAADALYVSGPRTAPAPSLHALCDGRAMATPFQTAQRRDAIHYGVKIPSICTSFVSQFGRDRRRDSQDSYFVYDDAGKGLNLLFNAIRAGRSLAVSYNLQSDIQRTSRQRSPLITKRSV